MRRLLIRGARVLGFEDRYDEPAAADLLIEDGVISAIGRTFRLRPLSPDKATMVLS